MTKIRKNPPFPLSLDVIPAQAGIQVFFFWSSAFLGVTVILLQFIPSLMLSRHDKILEENKDHQWVDLLFSVKEQLFS